MPVAFTVTVKLMGQATGLPFRAANAEELLGAVITSPHFGTGGFLEDAQQALVARTSPLVEGMVYVWHPSPRSE